MLFDCKHADSELFVSRDKKETTFKMKCDCAEGFVGVEDPNLDGERVNRFKDRLVDPLVKGLAGLLRSQENRIQFLEGKGDTYEALVDMTRSCADFITVTLMILKKEREAYTDDLHDLTPMMLGMHEITSKIFEVERQTGLSAAALTAEASALRKLLGDEKWYESYLPANCYYTADFTFPPEETQCD